MAKKKIAEYIEHWMAEFEHASDYEIHRTEFVKEAGDWYLRVFIDKLEEGGYGVMSTDDCELISRYLSDKLDEEDPISQNYVLEVSSPGMDRPLITDKDFTRFAGEQVEIKLYEAIDGSKLLLGVLVGRSEGVVTVTDPKGKEIALPEEKIAKINLAVVF